MHIVHLALGGCLAAPPVRYGLTADTGGHIAYVLDAALAQAAREDVEAVTIVTRAFDDARLGPIYAAPVEIVGTKVTIRRLRTANPAYLEKDALAGELDALGAELIAWLNTLSRMPAVIHAHFADAAAMAKAARHATGVPFVYTPHALGLDKRKAGQPGATIDRRIAAERDAIAAADAMIVSTKDEAERQVAAYGVSVGERVACLRPGVPDRRCDPRQASDIVRRMAMALDYPDRPILLAVARPVRKKNLTAVVAGYAAHPLLREHANLVVLAGQHETADAQEQAVLDELRAAAARPELAGRVFLPTEHAPQDVEALYALAAGGGVHVNAAIHEPFGLTVIEAAAAGTPVVATRNGGPSEVVAILGNGTLIDPADPAAIAAAAWDIVRDPARHHALAAAGRRNLAAFDWSDYAARSLAVYRGLAASSTPGMLATDIDNTLTGCRASARAFTAWAERRTLPFVVATGRGFEDARAVLAEWGLPMPDAFIVDVGTRIMLRDGQGGWVRDAGFDRLIGARWDGDAVRAALTPFAAALQPDECQRPAKLSYFGDAADSARIRAALQAARLAARVIFSHGRFIDVIPANAGKAAAIAFHAASRGIPLSACIAAGDSGNDADMLTECGHAIVVANADADLADLPAHPGLYRTRGAHAAGVLEGLARLTGPLDRAGTVADRPAAA